MTPDDFIREICLESQTGGSALEIGFAQLGSEPGWSMKARRLSRLKVALLAAALGFAIAQSVAGVLALRDRPAFFAWLVPAALYLLVIGVVGWFRASGVVPLWLDSARGLVLGALGDAQLRALRRER